MKAARIVGFLFAYAILYGVNLTGWTMLSGSVDWQGGDWMASTVNVFASAINRFSQALNPSQSSVENLIIIAWILSVLIGTVAAFYHFYRFNKAEEFARNAWSKFLWFGLITLMMFPSLMYAARQLFPVSKPLWIALLLLTLVETLVVEPVLLALMILITLIVFFSLFPLHKKN